MDLAQLTYDAAKSLEGTTFDVDLPDGSSIRMRLDEVLRYELRQGRRARAPKREPFSLYFLGPLEPLLPQAMYTLRSDTVTFKQVFIVPIARNAEATEYEAVFA